MNSRRIVFDSILLFTYSDPDGLGFLVESRRSESW